MKQILFLLLFPCLALAQYPSNGNQKITLGEQTTADGLIWRGVAADTTLTAKSDTAAYFVLDTANLNLYTYKASATGRKWRQLGADTAAIAYVNTYGTQTVNGAKTFNSTVTATRFDPTSSSASGTGMFLPAANTLGFSTNGTEKMRITSGGNVGIGDASAANRLTVYQDVNGDARISLANPNTGTSARSFIYTFTTGNRYVGFFQYGANAAGTTLGLTNASLSFVEAGADNTAFLINQGSTTAPLVLSTNNNQRMRITSDGEVYVAGTTDRGAYNLQVNGTGVWGEGAYVNGSDGNIKENIRNLDSSLNIVNNLKPVVFNYINQSVNNDTKHLGFIAQDVYQTLENKDYLGSIVRSDGETLSIAYSNIIPLLTKAIQEQNQLIKQLEQRIINLENK